MSLQAMGHATASTVVNLSRNAYIYIPIMYIMGAIGGMNGIVWAFPVTDVICIILSVVVLKSSIVKCFDR